MADFSAVHHPHLLTRRRPGVGAGLEATATTIPAIERKNEGSLADRAQVYDRALRQSQHAAASRRRGPGGSMLGVSAMGPGPSNSSMFGGLSTAQTAVLGDSHGSVYVGSGADQGGVSRTSGLEGTGKGIPDDDLAPDGGVGSGLGESYVDGGKRSKPYGRNSEEEEEEGLEDGGVLGLLAQIYGTREGPARVI
jgi:autophagy-related protein 9